MSSSFQVISASLNASRKMTVENNSLKTEPFLVDLYASRKVNECDFPGISVLNLVQFTSNIFKGKHGVTPRKSPVVIETYPNYSSNPEDLCMVCSVNTSYRSINLSLLQGETKMGLFLFTLRPGILNKTEAKLLVQNWSIQLDSISQHIEQIISKEDDLNEKQTGEREECMFHADLTLN